MGFGLIWYAALDSRRNLAVDCISQQSVRLILRFQCVWQFVNRFRLVSFVFWHLFNASAIFRGHQKDAQRKIMQYGCGISSRSVVGTRLVTKTMPRIAYCPELVAIGGLGHPGKLFSLIFIDFSRIWGHLGPEGWPACGGLWRPVAGLSYPFKMMQ